MTRFAFQNSVFSASNFSQIQKFIASKTSRKLITEKAEKKVKSIENEAVT